MSVQRSSKISFCGPARPEIWGSLKSLAQSLAKSSSINYGSTLPLQGARFIQIENVSSLVLNFIADTAPRGPLINCRSNFCTPYAIDQRIELNA